jgi:hypothetical protein
MRPNSTILNPSMRYQPLEPTYQNARDERYDNIEMNQQPPPDFPYRPPAGSPPNLEQRSQDSKAHFQNDNNERPVRRWPMQSQHVATITPLRGFIIFFDAILASTPIMFIGNSSLFVKIVSSYLTNIEVLALIAARLDGKQVTDYGHKLEQTLLLSPTIFPVIFAALMGRCFKHVGLFLAERGTTLGRLEQLVGCQSLFSALERQIALRSWSVVGLLLTLVWVLSPVGGQSALRLLETETKAELSVGKYQYLSPLASQDSFLMGASAINSGRSTFTSLFLAALLSSTKYQNTPMDLWGNVKIPSYRSIENSTSDASKIVRSDNGNVTYASLIGIPVSGLKISGYSTYSLRARQWDINCSSNEEKSPNATQFGNLTTTWKLNMTSTCDNYPCPFDLKSIDSTDNFTVASCAASYGYYEASIACNGTDQTVCAAETLRQLDTFEDGYTQDYDEFARSNLLLNLFTSLPRTDNFGVADAGARGSTYMERWMIDPWNFIGAKYDNVDLYKLSPDILGERLTILVNTFYQSTYATTALGGNLPKNLTELSADSTFLTFNATEARITDESHLIYRCNWRWFATLLLSAIVLQIAAYAGLVLKYVTLAPDILGFVSSLTLLNPYVPTPPGGTTLNGLERAALLYDLPIRIGDVCANEPVGAIAMARSDLGRVGKLDRKKFYI